MHVFYLKSTVDTDSKGIQFRIEHRTDWSFGPTFCEKMGRDLPTVEDLATDYDKVYMEDNDSPVDLDSIFHDFQADFMPNDIRDQVMNVVRRSHTSMSVGDIVVDHGNIWMVDSFGFTKIGEVA